MQVVEFTYKSSEVNPSVFLLLFFRMAGIYVYEHFFDLHIDKEDILFFQIEGKSDFNNVIPSDSALYYISCKDELDKYKRECNKKQNDVVIVSKNCAMELAEDVEDYIIFSGMCNSIFLTEIINEWYKKNVIDGKEWREFLEIANWYDNCNICSLILKGKFFYPAKDDSEFYQMRDDYLYSINDIFKRLKQNDGVAGDCEQVYLQFAVINMLYEVNLYCISCDKFMVHDEKQLVAVCKNLLEIAKENKRVEPSAYGLLAQIYENLVMDPNVAYEYYLPACEPYNAYAFFRKALYWRQYKKNVYEAKKYCLRSIECYPEYYRAWYNLACCYLAMEEYENAILAFHKVGEILNNRWEKHVLRTLEIDYLFKAYTQCGYIYYNFLGNIYHSIRENVKAVDVWEEIDQSTFWQQVLKGVGQNQDLMEMRERTKKKLDVEKIYCVIYKLAKKSGDEDVMEEYWNKINKNGG